jgi:hypothetical protein
MLLRCHPAKCSPEEIERSHVLARAFVRDPEDGFMIAIFRPFTGSRTNTRDTTSLRSSFLNGYFAG